MIIDGAFGYHILLYTMLYPFGWRGVHPIPRLPVKSYALPVHEIVTSIVLVLPYGTN